jgi:hypothetical protein
LSDCTPHVQTPGRSPERHPGRTGSVVGCPKEHQRHLELAANHPKINVGYTRIVTIATDPRHTLQEFRNLAG